MTSTDVKRGEYRIIRVDGTEELVEQRPHMDRIAKAIGADCLDTVDVAYPTIMLVDDTGMCDGRPVNEKATALYRSICYPGTFGFIHGDVALVNDNDF